MEDGAILKGSVQVQAAQLSTLSEQLDLAARADEFLTEMAMAKEFGYKVRAFHHALEAYKVADDLAAHVVPELRLVQRELDQPAAELDEDHLHQRPVDSLQPGNSR